MLTIQSTINIAGQTVPQIIPVVQGDTGRSILFTLADFTIPQGSTATYYVQKPSGEAVYNAATIDGNTVLVELTAQSIIEHGDNYGQVRIENDGEVVTSFDFILLVKPFRGIDATQSTTEMNIFDKAVEQASEAIDDAKDEALDEINQTTGNFAEAFSASKAYSAGEYVMQSGHLYRFTSNHAAGAWTGSDAEAVTVGEELTDVKDGLHSYNSYDMLRQFGTFTNRTGGGITYTWNDEHTVCTAVGTTTDLSIDNLYSGSGMPEGIEAGKTYRVMCNTTDINLMLEIIPYAGSTSLGSTFITEDSDYTVPESATNLRIRLRTRHTSESPSTVNATISVQILNALTNSELAERTEANKLKSDYAVNTIEAYNAFDMLQKFGTYANKTSGGVTYTWNADKTICTAVGTTTGLSINNIYAGSELPSGVVAGEKYFIKCNTTDTNLILEIIAYNGSTTIKDDYITEDTPYIVPYEATTIRVRLRTRHTSTASSTVNATISVQFLNAPTNQQLVDEIEKPPMGYMQIFPKYTTIGDSLMGGYMNRNGITINTATAKEAGNNWVNYLALRIGRTFTNLAVGGSTTGDWRSNYISTANIDTDCYIVGLGVNDHRQTVSIGTASDIATDFTDNANSFYGNYDYILRQLMAWKPNAHIFCFTIPEIEGGTSADYNVAIRAITALYPTKVHLIDLAIDYADYYDNPIVYTNYTGGHFNPIAYSYFSQVIEKAINTFMQNNDTDFATAPYA